MDSDALNSGALSTEVRAALTGRQVHHALQRLLSDVARTQSVELCSRDGRDKALSSAPDAYAAVYVHRSDLSIALEPADARRLHERYGLRLDKKTRATHYVHIAPAQAEDSTLQAVIGDALQTAFERAFHGERWTRGAEDRARPWGDSCDIHNLPKNRLGECDYCA